MLIAATGSITWSCGSKELPTCVSRRLSRNPSLTCTQPNRYSVCVSHPGCAAQIKTFGHLETDDLGHLCVTFSLPDESLQLPHRPEYDAEIRVSDCERSRASLLNIQPFSPSIDSLTAPLHHPPVPPPYQAVRCMGMQLFDFQ